MLSPEEQKAKHAEASKRWYAKNKAKMAEYYKENAEMLKARTRARQQAKKDYISAYNAKRRVTHREHIRKLRKAVYARHAEENRARSRRYQKANKEKIQITRQRYRTEHRDRIIESRKQFHKKNAERLNKRSRNYYKDHKAERNKKQSEYERSFPIEARARKQKYRATHRRELAARAKARRDCPGHHTAQDVRDLYGVNVKLLRWLLSTQSREPWITSSRFTMEAQMLPIIFSCCVDRVIAKSILRMIFNGRTNTVCCSANAGVAYEGVRCLYP